MVEETEYIGIVLTATTRSRVFIGQLVEARRKRMLSFESCRSRMCVSKGNWEVLHYSVSNRATI